VPGIAISANNAILATAGADRTLRYWTPDKGQPVAVVGAHSAPLTSLLLTPASNAVYTGSEDGTVKVWAVPPVASRAVAQPHADAVTVVALSPDGSQIYTASADKSVRVSNFANGQPVRTLAGAPAAVVSLAVNPGNTQTAGGTSDRYLLLWNNADGKLLSQVPAHAGAVNAVAFHGQGAQVATGGADGFVRLWALPIQPTRVLTHADAVRVAATADGKRLFTGGNDKTVYSWPVPPTGQAPPMQPERKFAGHPAAVTAVAVSPNGSVLASAGEDGVIRFWNQANSQQTDTIGAHAGAVTSLAFDPTNAKLLSTSLDGSIKLWQLPLVPAKAFAHPDQATCVAVSPDGNSLLTGCNDKQARIWTLANGQARPLTGPAGALNGVAWSSNGAQAAGVSADKLLLVWNAADGKEVVRIAGLPAEGRSVAFSPDGKQVVAGLADNSVRLYDLAMKKEVKDFKGHTGPSSAVIFTPKGDQVLSASADKTVQIHNVADGAPKGKLEHGAPITSLEVSKDGTKAVTGAADRTVKVWTLADGKAVATITTPAEVRGASLSPDGTRLLVAGADNKARLYTLDGKLQEHFDHGGPVLAAVWHGDGKRFFTASADKNVRQLSPALLWQADGGGPVRQAAFSVKGDRIVSGGDDKAVKIWNAADGKPIKALANAHGGPVVGVGISADSLRVVSAGADKTVKVWNVPAAAPFPDAPAASFPLPANADAVAISPNGTRVAASVLAAPTAGQVLVYDVTPGRDPVTAPLQVLVEHTGAIPSLTFLADNRTLLTASADKTVRLIDVAAVGVLNAHPGGVTATAYHSNNTQLLTAGADKTLKLWDLATGKAAKTFGPLAGPVTAATFSKDFTVAAGAAGKEVKAWTIADGKQVTAFATPGEVSALAYNTDKSRIATAESDGAARVWDVATGKELQFFPHTGAVKGVAFHPNNNNIVSGGADKTATVHQLQITRLLVVGSPVRGLGITPNASHLLTAGDDKSVKLWNLGNGNLERALPAAPDLLRAVAVSKNNALIATGGQDKKVRLYTFADGKEVKALDAPGVIRNLAFSPNNAMLAATCEDGSVATWTVTFNPGQPPPPEFGAAGLTYHHAGGAYDVVFGPDNSSLYSGGADKKLTLWKVPSPAPVKNFGHPNLVDSVAFQPMKPSNLLATGCHDGKMRVYDLAKGTLLKEVTAHVTTPMGGQPTPGPIYCLTWTPDGKQVLTGSLDHSMKLWDPVSGNLVKEFKGYKEKDFEKGHRDGIFCTAFSPDGKLLASGSSDRTVKLWNVADGSVVREFVNPKLKAPPPPTPAPSHPGWVYGVRFTPDGKYLISAGGAPRNQGYLAVWKVDDGTLVHGEEMPLGTIFSLALSPDGKTLAIGTGGSVRPAGAQDTNASYLLKVPLK
jgi:WD40 repeat protein